MVSADYTRLRELLENESYPHRYTHKFIGRKTEAFAASVAVFEQRFPRAARTGERESGGGAAYLAYTYELLADSPDEIIELVRATAEIADLKMIL